MLMFVLITCWVGLKRCGKSCRLRWLNYLRPDIKHGDFTEDEDRIIYHLFTTIGSRYFFGYDLERLIQLCLDSRSDVDFERV